MLLETRMLQGGFVFIIDVVLLGLGHLNSLF